MSGVFVKTDSTTWKAATNYYVKTSTGWKEINQINAKINSTEWKDSGIIKNNLTIHYDGYNTNSYSGTQTTIDGVAYDWLDLSGNGHHAQVDPQTVSGRITFDTTEKAFEFASVTGTANQNDNISMNKSYVTGPSDAITNLTLAAWIKCNSGTLGRGNGDPRLIASFDRSAVWRFGVGTDAGNNAYETLSAGKLVFAFVGTNASGNAVFRGDRIGGGGHGSHNSTSHTYDLRDDSWHYVAVTFTTTELRYYVDGVKIDTQTNSGFGAISGGVESESPSFGMLGTGSEASAFSGAVFPAHLFAGKIGAFHYYTSGSDSAATLTDAQILHNFNALKYRYGFT